MKRYIVASEQPGELTPQVIKKILNEHGIDTTAHNYEMQAEVYKRYESGNLYALKFRANGDWLAYFAMQFHKRPSADAIDDWFGYEEDFRDFVDDNPTVEDMKMYASDHWYGDGDDWVIYLKNLDTNKVLYESEYSYQEEYEDMDEEEGWD